MPFKLRVTFTGMCLFVPEPAKERVHVLLVAPDEDPMVGRTTAMKMERHLPRLFYDAAHDQANTVTPSATSYRCVSLEDKVLDLTSVPGVRNFLTPPASVADLTPFVTELAQNWIQANAPPKIAGHVILPAASVKQLSCDSGPWDLGGNVQLHAHKLAWDIDSPALDQYQLNWQLDGLRGTGDLPLVPLHGLQMPDGLGIELRVKNVVRSESIPGDPLPTAAPSPNAPAPHFAAYYDLFGKQGPDLKFEPEHGSNATSLTTGDPQLCGGALGDLYSCMLAQATLQGGQ